jgi:hypothetical protein
MTQPPQPPQQPGSWQDPSWPPPQQGQPPQQPYADPYAAAPASPGYAVPPGSPAYPGYGYGAPAPIAQQKTNTMAIVSLVLALCGLCTVIAAPIGAILGHVGRRQIRDRGEGGAGLALAGIIVGWVVTALWVAYFAVVIGFVVYAAKHPNVFPTPTP